MFPLAKKQMRRAPNGDVLLITEVYVEGGMASYKRRIENNQMTPQTASAPIPKLAAMPLVRHESGAPIDIGFVHTTKPDGPGPWQRWSKGSWVSPDNDGDDLYRRVDIEALRAGIKSEPLDANVDPTGAPRMAMTACNTCLDIIVYRSDKKRPATCQACKDVSPRRYGLRRLRDADR